MTNKKNNFSHIKDLQNFKEANSIPFLNTNSKISIIEQKETLRIDINMKSNIKNNTDESIAIDYKVNKQVPLMHILMFIMK